ncbi:Transforming growth factor beta-1-induced transcript 1 protein [Coemansia sp. RSA 1365]|nr:Transforming growth factor beta-1-induced transcript 1 protein [Coemansia sp. RSA 1365]
MSIESAATTVEQQSGDQAQALSSDVDGATPPLPSTHDAVSDQTLSEALRTGDRDAVEAIVHKLTGQLETLKMEAVLTTHSAETETSKQHRAGSVLGLPPPSLDDEQRRRRLSSLPDITPVALEGGVRDRRKRMTMAFGIGESEPTVTGLVCAYCGMGLEEDLDSAGKMTLSSDIGYCCSNCESILSTTVVSDGKGIENAAGDRGSSYFESAPGSDAQTTCDTCGGALGEEYVNVLGRRFHVTHFVCEDCNIPLYALGGYLQDPQGDNKFYCQRDYLQRFSPSCHACSVQITSGEMAVALGRTYHSECFVCSICQSPFVGDVCYEHNSQPLCEWHWFIQNGLLCTECGGIIKNQCVLTRGKKYHQACAESKYGEHAISIDEARRQQRSAKQQPATATVAS